MTLVEILVVMAIIAILVSLTTATITAYSARAQREGTQAVIAQLALAVEEFRELYGSYPYHHIKDDPDRNAAVHAPEDPSTYGNLGGELASSEDHFDIRNLYGLLRETGVLKEPIDARFLRNVNAPNPPGSDYDLVVLDAWEQPLGYHYPRWDGTSWRTDRFDLWSSGPDRRDSRDVPGDRFNASAKTEPEDLDNIVWGEF